jgi:HEPN domain-containing protein
MTSVGDEYLRRWLVKANEDITTIDALISSSPEKHSSAICFHAQQAVEKFLKAFLVYKGIDFPRTHDVDMLLAMCKPLHADAFNIELKELTEFGVDVRYPDDFFTPEAEQALEYGAIAMSVKEIVERLIA